MEDLDFTQLPIILTVSLIVVGILIVLATIVSGIVSIILFIKYIKYNRKKNSIMLTGEEVARKILDNNGLTNIKVKCSGSFLFGNSYSHYFKKVRLRRLTWKKQSLTSLGMASQKSALAILDKEKDKDMITRNRLTPITYFGPLFCLPLIILGLILDIFFFNMQGISSILGLALGLGLYVVAFIMSIVILKTEKKAQAKALKILKANDMATSEELNDLKKLFKLYNIEYINNLIIALLEMIYRILQIVAKIVINSKK